MGSTFWYWHRNKIMAITFAAIGLVAFILSYVFFGLRYGFGYLVSSPFTIINILINLVILLMLLITNIQNDNRAFNAITMLVFLVVWDMIVSWLPGGLGLYGVFGSSPLLLTLGIFLLLSTVGTAVLGVCSFVFLFRYRLGRASFERLMLFFRLFAAVLTVELVLEVVTIVLYAGFEPFSFTFYVLSNLSIASTGVACLFTLRRLRV